MSELSNYLENELLEHIFSIDGGYAQPSIYVALFTNNPDEDGSGTEVSGGSYARVLVSAWSRLGNVVDNDSAIEFPEASGSWGTVTHFALYDAATSGNILAYSALDFSQAVASGETVRFAAGDLDFSLD